MTAASPPLTDRLQRPLARELPALTRIAVVLLVIGAVAYFVSMAVAGVLYVLFILALAVTSPKYVYMLIFATAPFVWDVGGGPVNMAVSEITLVAALPVLLMRTKSAHWRRLMNPLWLPIAGYFAICIFSSVVNGSVISGLSSILQMSIYMVMAILVFTVAVETPSDLVPAFYGLIFACVLLSLMLLVAGSNYVLGLHKNLIGTEIMYASIVGFELWMCRASQRASKIVLTIALSLLFIGLVFTVSRGAWVGGFVGILLILLLRRQFGLAVRIGLLVMPMIAVGWLVAPSEIKGHALDFDVNDKFGSAAARVQSIQYAYQYFEQSPFFGAGVGLRKQYDATNVLMSTLAETGMFGLAAFSALFGTLFWMAWQAQRRLLRSDPNFSILVMGTALMFAKLVHGCVDHYWGRGVVPVWAGAGMVCFEYFRARRQAPGSSAGRLAYGKQSLRTIPRREKR